ncbi:MAG TPA: secondary thiamine-phosphate synthase enzyme YjbQ [Novimethylophilus sp.]|jgi:secondary thiamine-phosphate synthase enzyme|uniref:secondary thiamine-phosphate synthase enzyme YjbQ n=1 Tax=Novimethylophilus sp. TaxID=2137426 RepID=UPI002F404089
MRQIAHQITVKTHERHLYDITGEVTAWVHAGGFRTGLLTLYIQHTSASLMINENYDPDVLKDMERFFDRLVTDGDPLFVHTAEGPDDMPAHIRTALTQVNLSIPLIDGKLALGTWQGIFLFEHRHLPMARRVMLHLLGE